MKSKSMQGSKLSLQGDMDRLLQRMASAQAAKLASFANTDVIDLATTSAESSPRDLSEELPSRVPTQPAERPVAVDESAAESSRQEPSREARHGEDALQPAPEEEVQRGCSERTECQAVSVVEPTTGAISKFRDEPEGCESRRSPEHAERQSVSASEQLSGLPNGLCSRPQEAQRSPERIDYQPVPIVEQAGGLPDGFWDELQYGGISPDCSSSGVQPSSGSRGGLEATALSRPAETDCRWAVHLDLVPIL